MNLLRGTAAFTIAILVLAPELLVRAQGSPPATPLTLITREGRRPVPTTLLSGQELIALDDVATLFQVSVMEDSLDRRRHRLLPRPDHRARRRISRWPR